MALAGVVSPLGNSMKLDLQREPSANGATLGALYIDDLWVCWTIEDQIREKLGVPVDQWKIYGKTAIPAGAYRVVVNQSPRLGFPTPLLIDVPGFTGIRIHPFNRAEESLGCIGPGMERSASSVLESRRAFNMLMHAIAGVQDITINIRNPWSWK